jgi:hypothetical protein
MTARHVRWWLLGVLVVLGPAAGRAQSSGFPGSATSTGAPGSGSSSGGGSQASSSATTGAGAFDPLSQLAARLFGTYRVPGAPVVDATGTYRVPSAGGGGDSSGSGGSTASTAGAPASGSSTTTGGSATSGP